MNKVYDTSNSISYLPSLNRFVDDSGIIVHDLSSLFSMWQIDEWRHNGRDGTLMTKDGLLMDVYYLEPEEEEEALNLLAVRDYTSRSTERLRY